MLLNIYFLHFLLLTELFVIESLSTIVILVLCHLKNKLNATLDNETLDTQREDIATVEILFKRK